MRDLVDTLSLLGALQGAGLCAVLLLRRGKDALAERLLGGLMGAVAALLFNDYCESRWAFNGYPHVLAVAAPLPFTFGPLLYLYIVALTRPLAKPDPRWLLHFLPALLDLAYMSIRFYGLGGEEKLAVVRAIATGHAPGPLHVVQAVQAIQAVSYLAASWRELGRYGRKMRGFYSDLSRVDLRWLRAMVIAHAGTWSLVITSYGLRIAGVELSGAQALSRGVEVGSSVVIFLTGYISLWQPELFAKADAASRVEVEPAEPVPAPPRHAPTPPTPPTPLTLAAVPAHEPARVKYQRNRIDDAEATELVERLLHLMREQHPYRDGGLTLPALADTLSVTPHALSQILNVHVEKTFYAFVNAYRVAAVKEALADPAQSARGVLEIAFEAGFNSKSTLNTFFKRETGLTPSEYRSQAQKRPRQVEAA